MLIFGDESGDTGFKFKQGSSPYFTVAFVVVDSEEIAESCRRAIADIRRKRRLPESYEFHFFHDSHHFRLDFLRAVVGVDFRVMTLTLNKAKLSASSYRGFEDAYQWLCASLLEHIQALMPSRHGAVRLILDEAGSREFRRYLSRQITRTWGPDSDLGITRLTSRRSSSESLLQLADYVAGIANRRLMGRKWSDLYADLLKPRWMIDDIWPE